MIKRKGKEGKEKKEKRKEKKNLISEFVLYKDKAYFYFFFYLEIV